MSSDPAPDPTALERAQNVKREHEANLMDLPNVVAVGVGLRTAGGEPTGEVAIVVSVTEKVSKKALASGEAIPAELDGVPVDVQISGPFTARQE